MSKVLIVEDEASLVDVYSEILISSGYAVSQALDGESALSEIYKGDWDLLLLDIMLPRLDGLEVLKTINASPELHSKPVVVISNLENRTVIDSCLKLGAREFLIKSEKTPLDILNAVDRHLHNEKILEIS